MNLRIFSTGLLPVPEIAPPNITKTVNVTIRGANPHKIDMYMIPDHPYEPGSGHKRSRLDFDLSKLGAANGEYVQVKVSLAHRSVFFMPDTPDGHGGFIRNALTLGNAEAVAHFANLRPMAFPSADNALVQDISFICKVTKNGGGGDPLPFNIGLLVREPNTDFELPIILDPKVKNDS